jgi:hypothetical protein
MNNKLRDKLDQLEPIPGIVWVDLYQYLMLVAQNNGEAYRNASPEQAAVEAVKDLTSLMKVELLELERIVSSELNRYWKALEGSEEVKDEEA